jgi:hypothetical protein
MAVSKGLDNIVDKLAKDIDAFEFGKVEDIDIALQAFIQKVQRNLDENDLNASSQLRQSINDLPTISSNGVLRLRIELEDYWRDVDEGTKPKGVTKENIAKLLPDIVKWIQRKPSVQLSKIKKRETLAYLITRAILRKGTIKRFGYKGSKFLSSELPGFKENIIKVLEQQITR